MNFNSQICTTREQSERLLALGLKVETADMEIHEFFDDEKEIFEVGFANQGYMEPEMEETVICSPAWSLHRLIEMLNYQVIHNGKKYEPTIAIDGMAYQDVYDKDPVVGWSGDFYTDVIDCIEWLITEEYFNKEYLEE